MPLPVPPDLEEALAQVPAARAHFDRLPSQRKDDWIAWVERPRLHGGRRRRIRQLLRTLGAPPPTELPAPDRPAPDRPAPQAVGRRPAGPVAEPLPPGTAWWPWLLGLALLLLVAALLVWLLAYRGGGGGAVVLRKGTVPNLVGERLPAARRQARQADVVLAVTRRVAAHPRGTIVDQEPVPGTTVPSGSRVRVVVSNGPPRQPVPDVTGLAAPEAAARLQQAGFRPKLVQVAASGPAGKVVSQAPRAGARAPRGGRVVLRVAAAGPGSTATATAPTQTAATATTGSPAPAPAATTGARAAGVAVPRLVGTGLGTALTALEQAGLLATVKMQTSQAPAGQVRGQSPAAGARVPAGTRVQVNVAEGPSPGNPTQIPDVAGEDEATATSDLQDAGFRVVVVQTSRGSGASGTVVEQQPAAGTTVASDDVVAIYVRR